MKGIRKLFLGLIFMTLIGVGFKVDVKAADGITINSLTLPDSWGAAEVNATVKFSYSQSTFPVEGGADVPITFRMFDSADNPIGTAVEATFRHPAADDFRIVYNGESHPVSGTAGTVTDMSVKITTANVAALVLDDVTANLKVKDITPEGDATSATKEVTGRKVTLSAVKPSGATITTGVTYTPQKEFYLLKEASKVIRVTESFDAYTFSEWNDEWPENERTITMTDSTLEYTAKYGLNTNALKITDLIDASVPAGKKSEFTINSTDFTVAQLSALETATLNGVTIPFHSDGTKVWFTPKIGIIGYDLPLKFVVDGNEFTYTINVVDTSNTAIAFSPATYSINLSTPTKLKLTYTGAKPDSVSYTVEPAGSLTLTDKSIEGVTVTGTTAGTGIKVKATATYSPVGGVTPTADPAYATVTLQSLVMKSDLYVNKGQTVNLSDFISTGNKTSNVTITNNASSYVETSASTGVIKDITVKGKSSGTADKEKFIVEGNKMKVTCYPEPALSVETTSGSSSSGSYTYSYHVTMPKGVYYGDDTDVWVSDLKKAILIIKGSGDDPKKKEIVLDSDWKDESDKISMKVTKKLDVKTLTGYLRDIGKKDEESFKVYACAVNGKGNNDDKIKTEEKEIKAYKIALDTNGGKTSYTVNGDACYDYFYKIDGVEYTVVARGTGTLDKKNSVNADNATTSNGTATIVLGSSGAGVLGERKIKAAFTGSNTANDTTDGGDGGDGYDEVPKTGESKADIWILWTVLFISILGAGFMIWKRFGLVRAIAEAEQEQAYAEHEEQVKAEKKAKEDKLNMLKDLRNL